MTDDLGTLRPEVRAAMIRLESYLHITIGGKHFRSEDYDTIRAELLRLAEDAAMFAHAVSLGQRYKQRAETAEAELAALKARIAEAVIGKPIECDFENMTVTLQVDASFSTNGKPFRLVVEE